MSTGGELTRITLRVPGDLLAFVDAEVMRHTSAGRKWDRTREVLTALRQRQISKLPPERRAEVLSRLMEAREAAAAAPTDLFDAAAGEGVEANRAYGPDDGRGGGDGVR